MCGIAGIKNNGDIKTIERMLQAMEHRGPDGIGIYDDRECEIVLGNCRLAIQDLTAAAHMPMCTQDKKTIITYNGEVYNFKEIRRELEGKGCSFVSNSDTEVILAAYRKWGVDCLERLRGMFAFAIWDKEKRELFLARDRFGIKPLYWSRINSTFLFSSEIKGMLASGILSKRINYQALWDYLSLGAVPPPNTMVKDINALLPGHAMIVKDNNIRIWKYWDLDEAARKLDVPREENEAKEALREILGEVSALHMIADVNVGIFLSGGIDSSSLAGLMSKNSDMPLSTYSIGFSYDDQQHDELKYARVAAEKFKTNHKEYVIQGNEIYKELQMFFKYIDQPTTDGLNTYLISRKASTDVKVAISGLGADELFAGYPQFKSFERANNWLPNGNNLMRNIAKRLPLFIPGRIRIPAEFYSSSNLYRHVMTRPIFNEDEKIRNVNRELLQNLDKSLPVAEYYRKLIGHGKDVVQEVTYVEIYGYMARTLLRDADSLSMANSLELRVPFLDHKLAEFVYSLPPELKLSYGNSKYILKETLKDTLPKEIIARGKMGFNLPIGKWLQGPLEGCVEQSFLSPKIKEIFNTRSLEEIKSLIGGGYSEKPWSIIVLGNWLDRTGIIL